MSASPPSRWRIDLHCHTSHSYDGWTPPAELVQRARAAGLDRICVTDHGNMRGAFEAHEADPDLVIPGQEIRCACGTELIGIGLAHEIPEGLDLAETATRVRAQGGVVYAPHPFAYLGRSHWRASRALAAADIIESFNPRAFFPPWNARAAAAAAVSGKPAAASSDAHFPWEIGRVHTEVRPFHTVAELPEVLRDARLPAAGRTSWSCHLFSISLGLSRRITAAR